MKKTSKKRRFLFLGLAGAALLLYGAGELYYRSLMDGIAKTEQGESSYKYKFDMIVDRPNSGFWQEVYQSASENAADRDILLELKGAAWENRYDKLDFMNMSIASNADGIILQYSGEPELKEKIDEAVEKGIPVVTVLNDAGTSKRQSFIGVSDYQLGTAYAEQVEKYMDADTDNILILMKRNIDDMNKSQIYTRIRSAASKKTAPPRRLNVRIQNLLPAGNFETEEAVTDIFQQAGEIPDIFVCMDEETTECVRQAVINYNLAGKVKIIGYYLSEDILSALEKGIISVTCDVDTEQLGAYSVEALAEYLKEGYTSSYYSVDLAFHGKDDVKRIREERYSDEEASVE